MHDDKKDWWIEKNVIVKLWVAQGFIRSDRSRDIEEIGGLYFDDLLRRSLLQDVELDDDKNILGCKMHDLVHDLAQSVAGSDCSLVEIGKQASLNLNNLRHSFFVVNDEADEVASIWAILYKAHKLWTLLLVARIFRVPHDSFHHSRRLTIPLRNCLGQLKHLLYLDLSYTDIEKLLEGMGNCRSLQTLRLDDCSNLAKLPEGTKKMVSLGHLEFKGTMLMYLQQGMGRLTGLRTLTKFIVGGGDEGCKCRELKHLNHLQGRLQITGLESVKSRDEASEAELYKKQHIHALSLQYDYRRGEPLDDEVKTMEDVLQSLQPHTNLKVLQILDYQGSKLPKWIEDPAFSYLVKVGLWRCHKSKQLPGLGKLPSLKYLEIVGMEEVRYVGGEFSGDDNNGGNGGGVSFPKLETLLFDHMPNWEEWELRGGDGEVMPSLLHFHIYSCVRLGNLPEKLQRLNVLQELKIVRCEVLEERCRDGVEDHSKIAHIPCIRIG